MNRGAPREHEQFARVRRPADLLAGLSAIVGLAALLGLVHALPAGSRELSNDVARWILHLPRWLTVGAAVLAVVGCLVLAIIATTELVRHEARGAVNAGVGAGVAALASIAAAAIWHGGHGPVATAVLHGRNPTTLVVDTTFIAFLTASDLVRRSRWSRRCVLAGAALLLTGVAVDALTPFAVAASLFGATACGWLARWLLGAASVLPSAEDLRERLAAVHVTVSEIAPAVGTGSARTQGTLATGSALEIRMASRDNRGAGVARRLWALARLRPVASGHVSLSSRSHLERLALASYVANDSGVIAPRVVHLGEMSNETLVLVLALPDGEPIGESMDLATARALFGALRALHDAGVAHRDLRAANLVVAGGQAGFASLDTAVPGAGELVRRLDVTQLLTTLGKRVGAAAAVQAMRDAYRPADEDGVAAILQPIALAPWGWTAMREARGCVAEVRRELVGPDGSAPVTRLERFRWRTVVSAVALTLAAFVLIGQTANVNLLGTLRRADPVWFAVAVLGSAVTYLAAAENLAAFVPKRLSVIRGFFVQLSTAFVGVAMPPTVGHVAVNARYLRRQSVEDGAIAAAVALSQIVNVVTTLLLLLVIGLLTGSGTSSFKIAPSTDVVVALGAIALALGLLLLVPRTRSTLARHVLPGLRSAWPRLLEAASQPLRLAWGIGSNLLLTLGYAVAFVAALRAIGAHPPILPAVAVYLAGNAVGSAAPTPGGLGAVEAVLAAGLAAIGIPAHEAIPAVLVFRIATFWLPIPAGWVSFTLLQRRGVL